MEPTRRLTLLDGMTVIAATTCGFAAIRGSVPEVLRILPTVDPVGGSGNEP